MTMSKLVEKRLEDVVEAHEVLLSRISTNTFESTSTSTSTEIPITIAEAATQRSFASQPPFQSPSNTNLNITEIELNPPERAKPQDLLQDCYHQHGHGNTNEYVNVDDSTSTRSAGINLNININMINTNEPTQTQTQPHNADHLDYHKTTIKAITTISTLTEESHELSQIALQKFLPQLHLFGHDPHLDLQASASESDYSYSQQLNADLMTKRDRELLQRLGKCMGSFQNVHNFVSRCHVLIANMMGQVHGCLSPLYDWSTDANSLGRGNVEEMRDVMPEPPLFGSVRNVMPLLEGIGELLEVLIMVDAVVANNTVLGEAWDLYKSVVMDGEEDGDQGQGPVPFVDIRVGPSDSRGDSRGDNGSKDEANADADADADGGSKSISESQLHSSEQGSESGSSSNQHIHNNVLSPSPGEDDTETETSAKEEQEHNGSKTNPPHSKKDLMLLQQMLMQLDFTLFSSRSFLIAIEQNFDPTNEIFQNDNRDGDRDRGRGRRRPDGTSLALHDHLKTAIEFMYERCCEVIGTEKEYNSATAHTGHINIIGLYGLYCMYRRLLPSNIAPDENLHRSLCTLFPSKRPLVPLFGALPFFPVEFISRYAPLDRVKGMMIPSMDNIKAAAKKRLGKQDKSFPKDVSILFMKGLGWMVEAESGLAPTSASTGSDVNMNVTSEFVGENVNDERALVVAPIAYKMQLVRRGVEFGHRATKLLNHYLTMHKNLMEPIPSGHLRPIEKLCSMAKSIEQVLRRRRRDCVVAIHWASLKLIASSIFKSLDLLSNSSLRNSEEFTMKRIQIARIGASLSVLESLLKGTSTFSTTRLHAIKAALYACYEDHPDVRSRLNMSELEDMFYQLQLFSEDKLGFEACDCSFIYFHKALFAPLVRHSFHSSSHSAFSRIQLIFSALSDPSNTILPTSTYLKTLYNKSIYVDRYRSYLIENVMLKEVVYPLVESIESVLRHRIHTRNILEMPMPNPKQQAINHFVKFLDLPPINLCGMMFSIKTAVERLLEKSLYNSSTVGLKDSNTHSEMMALAKSYGLNLIDSNLPAGTADQGMDLMLIANDLEDFLANFNYNMNQQNFVERVPIDGRRFVNSVDIECISMSLSRHGFGVNKVVTNVIFSFISKALEELSQILSNDSIYSIMAKEKRWFEDESKRGVTCYPYDRVLAFKNEMIQVQGSGGTQPLLHEAKDTISKIGNALGLARLLRSAKLYNVSGSRQYSSKQNITSTKTNQSHPIGRSIQMLKTVLESPTLKTTCTFFPAAEIVRSLPRNHETWENLHILYPSLSLLWLEASASGKEMLRKKIKTSEGYYTDDGFSLGFAYLFEILDPEQGKCFDGMNWRKSSMEKFARDKTEMKMKADTIRDASGNDQSDSFFSSSSDPTVLAPDEDSEYTRLQVLAKRLETRRREMELLHYSMHVSRMIFSCN